MKNFRLKATELLWLVTFAIGLGVIFGAYRLLYFDLSAVAERNLATRHFPLLLVIHVAAGAVWFISGYLQFTPLFLKNRKLHRINGYIAIGCCAVSLLTIIAVYLWQPPMLFRGSLRLSLFSLTCTIVGYIAVRQKHLEVHRAWMIRSLVFAMVMPLDRLNSALHVVTGLPAIKFTTLTWASIFFAEFVVHRKLEFKILDRKYGVWNIPLAVLAAVSVGLCFWLTFNYELHFKHGRPS